jgi:hypothetical protein
MKACVAVARSRVNKGETYCDHREVGRCGAVFPFPSSCARVSVWSATVLRGAIIVIAALLLVALVGAGLWLWTPDLSRTRLETAYLDDPSDIMVVAGVGLHVRDTGPKDAPAIIMIHGFGFSLHTWEPWARALSDDYRVIRFDLPGSGLSGPDPTDTYNDARTLAVLSALMDQLGVDKGGHHR